MSVSGSSVTGEESGGGEVRTTVVDAGATTSTAAAATTLTAVTGHPSAPSTSHIAVRDLPTVGVLRASPSCSPTESYGTSSPRLPPTPRYTPSPERRGEELEQEVTMEEQPLSDSFPASAGKGKTVAAKGKGKAVTGDNTRFQLDRAFNDVGYFTIV